MTLISYFSDEVETTDTHSLVHMFNVVSSIQFDRLFVVCTFDRRCGLNIVKHFSTKCLYEKWKKINEWIKPPCSRLLTSMWVDWSRIQSICHVVKWAKWSVHHSMLGALQSPLTYSGQRPRLSVTSIETIQSVVTPTTRGLAGRKTDEIKRTYLMVSLMSWRLPRAIKPTLEDPEASFAGFCTWALHHERDTSLADVTIRSKLDTTHAQR